VPSEGIFFFKQAPRPDYRRRGLPPDRVGYQSRRRNAGQLGAATLASAVLNGAQEVPPVAAPGTGTFTLSFDSTQATLTGDADVHRAELLRRRGPPLHFGAAGTGGGAVVFDLSTVPFTSRWW
jgi:hypothetical protein